MLTKNGVIVFFTLMAGLLIPLNVALAYQVGVTFDPSTDERVVGYNVYYGPSSDFLEAEGIIDLGTDLTYYFSTLQEGRTYYFAATGYDQYGNESDFSNIISYKVAGSIDSDGDGTADSDDLCPDDPAKTDPGACGCGVPETDSDGNGIPDCNDQIDILGMGELEIDHNWTQVNFNKTFVDPVVIAKPAGANDLDPAVIRIRNVTGSGFEIRIQEWEYLDGNHDYESVSYIVIEKGSYIFPGGIKVEAGKFEADASGFRYIAFNDSFNQVPIVVASVTSVNENDAVTGRIRNIGLDGFRFCLQEEESTQIDHATETVSYIAWEPSSGTLNQFSFEVRTSGDSVTHTYQFIPYWNFYSQVPLLLADMQTSNGPDTASLRWRNKTMQGFDIWVEEERSRDTETKHISENIGFIVLSTLDKPIVDVNTDSDGDGLTDAEEIDLYQTDPHMADTDGDGLNDSEELIFWGANWSADPDFDGLSNIIDPDSDGDGFKDGMEVFKNSSPEDQTEIPRLIEIGEAVIDHVWQRVSFLESFYEPVVVANLLSLNGLHPATVKIRNVDRTGFDIRIQEWDYLDGSHTYELVGYIVMEKGDFLLPGNIMASAGTFRKAGGSFSPVRFSRSFGTTPVIITSVTTMNEQNAVSGRIRNINFDGFEYMLQEQESNSQEHVTETVSFIAWEPSIGYVDGINYEIGLTENAVTHDVFSIDFLSPFVSVPIVLADMQTTDGPDTSNLRLAGKDQYTFEILVGEEQSLDAEIVHTTETVGYMIYSW